jgi:hypothetical protein
MSPGLLIALGAALACVAVGIGVGVLASRWLFGGRQ